MQRGEVSVTPSGEESDGGSDRGKAGAGGRAREESDGAVIAGGWAR